MPEFASMFIHRNQKPINERDSCSKMETYFNKNQKRHAKNVEVFLTLKSKNE